MPRAWPRAASTTRVRPSEMSEMNDLHYLVLSALLAWGQLMLATELHVRIWTWRGIQQSFGNRDDLDPPSPVAGRAKRAAVNMLENLVLFVAVVTAARFADGDPDVLRMGAAVFFWARVGYFLVYLAGIAYLRSGLWTLSLVGVAMIGMQVF
ncbi:MAG: hypothetical protein B7733_04345 [Myxococcales bacterium FL481]|nr:MAG: hypothetical protein B7733_04345 [Myxococcales bacterium FL481]